MLRVCLDDCEVLQLLLLAAEDFARGSPPAEVTQLFTMATMTAVSKTDGGVRGIATGTSFRRLVARTLARQFMKDVEKTFRPFPVCSVDAGWHRLRRPRSSRNDRSGPSIESFINRRDRGLRPRVPQRFLGEIIGSRSTATPVAIRAISVLRSFGVSLGGR